MIRWLVIGYGNELRGDDGAGPRVARAISERAWPGVVALAVHQLTPELSARLAEAERAVFVDAAISDDAPAWSALAPRDEPPSGLGHLGDPAWILGLARDLFGHAPEAWLATLPARNLDFGETLSPETERGVAELLEKLEALLLPASSSGPEGPAHA